ncbi:MAG: hypothetical protein K2P84_14450, partial [Undibacterium sp.]|nr:hypothetical protein [Undibacterium sp.]
MYFGNSTGILEFDGQRWQLIATPGNPMVRSLALASDGTIFYGSVGDFGYLSASSSGKISAVSLKDAIPKDEQIFNDVWQIESTAQGIYFLTRSRIFRYYQGKVTTLSGKFASSQACVINGVLFYVDMDKGISLIDGDQIVPVPQLDGLANGARLTLARSGEHEMLIGRMSGDFRLVNLEPLWDTASKKYLPARPANNLVQAFPTELDGLLNENDAYLYKLMALTGDRFAISTIKAGVLIFDRNGKILQVINRNVGLSDNTVAGIMKDRSNNLWATTNSGISYIELSTPQTLFDTRNGIDGVTMSLAYHKGRLYVGGFQNIFVQQPFQYSLKDDTPKFMPLKQGPSEAWQFKEVKGELMAASGRGLYRIEGESATKIPKSSGNAYCLGYTSLWPDHLFVGLMGGV